MTRKFNSILFKNLSKSYYDGGNEIKILEDVNTHIEESKITLLLGRSGSGKSTLLNLISGIDVPSEGRVYINDLSLGDLSEEQRTVFRRKHIGIVFQSFHLISSLTVLDNVMLPLELNNINGGNITKTADEILKLVGLQSRANAYPDTLSGGEQQRTAIARSLVHSPQIIIADEPTGNLDNRTSDQIVNILFGLVREKNKTLIMATHSEDLIDRSDSAYLIENFRLKKIK